LQVQVPKKYTKDYYMKFLLEAFNKSQRYLEKR